MGLVQTIKVGESRIVGGQRVTLIGTRGNRASFTIDAPDGGRADVAIERCPNCGGTEHVPPLPGTVGLRCVKCCGVKPADIAKPVPTA